MSNYNARVPADKQYQLIMECRSSGLTDFQSWDSSRDLLQLGQQTQKESMP